MVFCKVMRPAIEQNETKRRQYLQKINTYTPEQLVFVNETSCDRRTANQGYGWAKEGERASRTSFCVRGKRYAPKFIISGTSYKPIFSYSLLPALSLDGILCLDIIEGSFNAVRFSQFIDGLLYVMNPYPGPNSVIVMDNCSIHKDQTIIEMIEEWYLYICVMKDPI